MKLTFKEFVLKESKNTYLDSYVKVLESIKKDIESSDSDEVEEAKKEGAEKLLKALERLINVVVKDGTYIEDKAVVDASKEILKGISNKVIEKFFDASLNVGKREKFEQFLQGSVFDVDKVGKKEIEAEKEEKITDKDIEKEAKEKAKDSSDLEKDVEKDLEQEKKSSKGAQKVLIGIVKSEDDGEVMSATIGETELPIKKIEGLDDFDDVLASMYNARELKNPAQITKRIKDLKGTVVYYFDFDKKNKDKEYLNIVKIK